MSILRYLLVISSIPEEFDSVYNDLQSDLKKRIEVIPHLLIMYGKMDDKRSNMEYVSSKMNEMCVKLQIGVISHSPEYEMSIETMTNSYNYTFDRKIMYEKAEKFYTPKSDIGYFGIAIYE
jgi:hypothetical protein